MIYCMSDIHGRKDKYDEMLATIQFSDEDTMYIIGDVVDRFEDGVEILRDIMDRPNIIMILGNHEKMLLDVLGPAGSKMNRSLWFSNGGHKTYSKMLYGIEDEERNKIIDFLLQLPLSIQFMMKTCNGHENFLLVHGFPIDEGFQHEEDLLWSRPYPAGYAALPEYLLEEGIITICGHTPTVFLTKDWESVMSIYHGDGFIDIDCGCGNDDPRCRLACLRLDDRREFYV